MNAECCEVGGLVGCVLESPRQRKNSLTAITCASSALSAQDSIHCSLSAVRFRDCAASHSYDVRQTRNHRCRLLARLVLFLPA